MKELFSEIFTGIGSGQAFLTSQGLFALTVVLYFLSAVLYFAYVTVRKNSIWYAAFGTALLGCLVETAALISRWIAAGWDHPPFTNMYESLVFFAWGIVVTYLVVEWRYKVRIIGAFVIPLAFAAMGLASVNPDQEISPLVPALQSIWLHIHVFTASVGYAAFLVAFGISLLYLIKDNVAFNRVFAACSVINVAGLLAVTKGKAIVAQFPINAVSKAHGAVHKLMIPETNPPEFQQIALPILGVVAALTVIAYVVAAFFAAAADTPKEGRAASKVRIVFWTANGLFTLLVVLFVGLSITHPRVAISGNPYSFAMIACLWFFSMLLASIEMGHKSIVATLPPAKKLDDMAYRAIMVAFPIMTLIIVTGAVWANQAWGRYWGWDPKETASLVTWIIYLLYLHTRITKGWTGRRTAYISIIGFVSVVFTFLGVNLLLSGLHSYAKG